MTEFIFSFILWVAIAWLWIGLGVVAVLVMDFHANRALDLIAGKSYGRYTIAWALWPATVLAVLLLQFNQRYRGSKLDDIDWPLDSL